MKYKTKGVCSSAIDFDVVDGKVRNVRFTAGCSGNLDAISTLVDGMDVHEVIDKIKGIECGRRGTSCADQLAIALEEKLNDAQ